MQRIFSVLLTLAAALAVGSSSPRPRSRPVRGGSDACHKNVGWLPDGSCHARFHHDYAGNVIKGRAFRLDEMSCGNGTRQCPDTHCDQVCRWECPTWNDDTSAGCIEMAPQDLAALAARHSRWFEPGVRYGFDRLRVRVVT